MRLLNNRAAGSLYDVAPTARPGTEGLLFIEEAFRGVEMALSEVGWSLPIWIITEADSQGELRLPARRIARHEVVRMMSCWVARVIAT